MSGIRRVHINIYLHENNFVSAIHDGIKGEVHSVKDGAFAYLHVPNVSTLGRENEITYQKETIVREDMASI